MTKKLNIQYKKFLAQKDKQKLLKEQFEDFLPEVVFRTTKLENPEVTRKQVESHL